MKETSYEDVIAEQKRAKDKEDKERMRLNKQKKEAKANKKKNDSLVKKKKGGMYNRVDPYVIYNDTCIIYYLLYRFA